MQNTHQKPQQIPIDFPVRTAQSREDFMIGDSNIDAVTWIDQWPNWPAPVIFLCGPAASGKSHLAAVWQTKTKAATLNPKELSQSDAQTLSMRGKHLVIDGIEPWLSDRESETTLFHLYNILKEERRTILLTSRAAPSHIDFAIPDLASRCRAAPTTTIKSPDDTLLQNIIVKMFADRQIQINDDILKYIMPRAERSFKSISDIVAKSDELALAKHRPVTIPIVRDALIALQDEGL
ncbi:MAG: DnaA/Hda family protein [Bdellovibrionales bacterium]